VSRWPSGNLEGLLAPEYKDGQTDLISRLRCGTCDAVLYDEATGPGELGAVCKAVAAHLMAEHGVRVEFRACDDPGCRHTN
jgi:hypothetical protein